MLFMLFFSYFISGVSLYKSYSSDTYSYYSMDHMKTYLSDVNSVAGSNHFYEYFLTESILSKSTTYLSYNGIDELLYSYNHLKNMLYIISKHHIAGINSDLGLLNNDDNLIFDSQYIQYYLNR